MKKIIIYISLSVLNYFPAQSLAYDYKSGIGMRGALSANVSLVSDYAFRGITQSDGGPAIQGGIDYIMKGDDGSGFYLGLWASNVDFNDSSEASSEFDWYGGFTYDINNFSFDAGLITYFYPGAESSLGYNFWEAQASVGYNFKAAFLEASINWSPKYFGNSGNAQYYKLYGQVTLPKGFTLDAHIGSQFIDNNAAFGSPDYMDWSLGLAYNLHGFDLKLQYIDTNIGKSSCAEGCDSKAIFTVSKSL